MFVDGVRCKYEFNTKEKKSNVISGSTRFSLFKKNQLLVGK